jgi:hypothetical protein
MVDSQQANPGRMIATAMLIGWVVVAMSGCSGDLYKSCSTEPLDCSQSASCVASPDYECESRTCAIYRDSDAVYEGFCTKACDSNAECPDGECRTFVVGTDDKYCVPSNKLSDE